MPCKATEPGGTKQKPGGRRPSPARPARAQEPPPQPPEGGKWASEPRRRKTERDKFLSEGELRRLFRAARELGEEPYALVAIGYNLGLRISETVALQRAAFARLGEGLVEIQTLKQKGDQPPDQIPVDPDTAALIQGYLKTLPRRQEYLFPGRGGKGHMSRWTAWRIFCEAARSAGLPLIYSPHSLRHSQGVAAWEGTKDLQYVKSKLRHRSLRSTMLYIHMSTKTQVELARKVKPVL